MALSNETLRECTRRLLLSRMRLLCHHGFYGLLLLHMRYAVDEAVETACTDGVRIIFGVEFLEGLTDDELDFVMMHEILHVVLQHCLRQGERDPELFNIACDTVVNSNILLENKMDERAITVARYGVSMHLTPDGKEGHLYTAEEVYEMLISRQKGRQSASGPSGKTPKGSAGNSGGGGGGGGAQDRPGGASSGGGRIGKATGPSWDDHSRWGSAEADEAELSEVWVKRLRDACAAMEIRDPSHSRGLVPAFAERILSELSRPQTDWRTVLNEFVQEEVADYSFSPPDRRFDETPFFLPDFNGTVEVVRDILFMIDTSGSMSDAMVTAAYSEVKGAIDQFDGKLCGWLGFFDAAVTEPCRFENVEEMKVIRPMGGGGTDFGVIFRYVKRYMSDSPPASIIILTDGYAPFPPEASAGGIPVLWLMTNSEVEPPWGRVTRITVP